MRHQRQHPNHTPKRATYQLTLPFELGVLIESSEPVHVMLNLTERLDYSHLNASYTRQPSEKEASPKQMFQLVLLGFMEGTHTTRKLESSCKHDIRFMYVLQGKKAPDHNRFWSFIKHRLQGAVAEHLFYQLSNYLYDAGEIDLANLFVDGTKIEANANRYTFVWKKSTNKYEARLDNKMDEFFNHLLNTYPLEIPSSASPDVCLNILRTHADSQNTLFVHGRGKRKTQLQRDIEMLESYLIRKCKYKNYNDIFKGRNSFSKTDPDATFMRMKDDHMMNGQLKPGYNLALGVSGEYIVGVDISSERSDQLTLIPLLDRMEQGMDGKRFENIGLDAGYESEENYTALESRGIAAFIKPQNYEKSKTRKFKNNVYLLENMPYHVDTDTYTCPANQPFVFSYTCTRKSASGFKSNVTVYECHACTGCPQKSECTRAKGNRKLYVAKDFLAFRKQSLERITSEQGKILRLNRSIQSEGAFGVLKEDYGFRRFARRGSTNVLTEVLIYAMAYNVNKFCNKQKRKLRGVILHQLKSA